jgi:hypothetical protein
MTDITPLVPRQPDPSLAVPLAGGGKFNLTAENRRISRLLRSIAARIARNAKSSRPISRPSSRNSRNAAFRWWQSLSIISSAAGALSPKGGPPNLRIGYGLDLRTARAFGLWISTSRGKTSAGIRKPAFSTSLACS